MTLDQKLKRASDDARARVQGLDVPPLRIGWLLVDDAAADNDDEEGWRVAGIDLCWYSPVPSWQWCSSSALSPCCKPDPMIR